MNESNYVTYTTGDFDLRPQVTRLKGMKFDSLVFGGDYMDSVIRCFRKSAVNDRLLTRMDLYYPLVCLTAVYPFGHDHIRDNQIHKLFFQIFNRFLTT